ncbi:MAG: O-antigen ligase family protein, partial [Candidatus Gallimonas sp.]
LNDAVTTQKKKSFLSHKIGVPFSGVRIDLDFFIHVFCFISVLLIGADRWGVTLLGVNFRVDQVLLCVFALLLVVKDRLTVTNNVWIVAFLLFSLISTVFSVSLVRGAMFYCSIVYNVIFLFYTFASYVRVYGLKFFLSLLRATFYVQFAVILVQFTLKVILGYEFSFLPSYGYYMGIPRFQIWFYEPSYLATYLIFWFALSCFMFLIGGERGYLTDLILALLMFVMSTSTSGFVGIAFVVATAYLIWICRRITWKKLVFPVFLIVLFLVFRFAFRSVYDVFISRLFEGSLDTASGGRIMGWSETWKVFLANPFFGVGPGNYGLYLGAEAGYVPSNVSLELLATLGIFAFLAFYGLTVSQIVRSVRLYRNSPSKESMTLVALAYALLVFTVILQINQGYLRLYHWMIFGMIEGAMRECSVKKN